MTRFSVSIAAVFSAAAFQVSGQPVGTPGPPVIGEQADGLSPKDALAAFRAYEGFKVIQSAAEPDVRQPVAMTIDARGRVWIAEAYEYPIRAEGDVGRDRILIFEDKDGDGVFDERKVFLEGLNLVSGLEVGFGGVWIGAAPYLMFVPDADGDDRPDGKPEILLNGFGWQDTHETLNSFIWGPDGWLYGCHGVFTHSKVGKPGTPEEERVPINAGVWRFHPQKRIFEVFANGTSNPWGVDFNDQGQAFVTACVIPHLFHIVQGGRYHRQAGRHFDPHTYDDLKTCADHLHYTGDQWTNSRDGSSSDFGGGHAHCGLTIYLGDSFPEMFRGRLLFNNLHGHRINQERLERKGSGFAGRHEPDFLFSNDRRHMGVSLRYGPDGGVFLTDWYDGQTCHNVNGEIWDRSTGRIYKIQYGGKESRKVDLGKAADLELAGYQAHRNDWYVRTARRILQERAVAGTLDVAGVKGTLEKLMEEGDGPVRLRALWAMHVIGALGEVRLLSLLEDGDEYVRAWSIQLLVEDREAGDEVVKRFSRMAVADRSPVVRLYLAAAMQRLRVELRWEIGEALSRRGEDEDDANLPLMVWYGVSDLVGVDARRASSMMLKSKLPKVTAFLARRLAGSGEGRDLLMESVRDQGGEGRLAGDVLEGLAAALATSGEVARPGNWEEASGIFSTLAGEKPRRNFEAVAIAFGDPRMAEKLRSVVADLEEKDDVRLAAWANLQRMRLPDAGELLMKLAEVEPDGLRARWIEGMATAGDARIIPYLSGKLEGLKGRERDAAVQVLAATEAGAKVLAGGLASGTLKRGEVSAFVARQMRSHDHAEISEAVEKHWGVISAGMAEDKRKEIEAWKERLTPKVMEKADLRNGRRIYEQTCHACHRLFGEGMNLGPDLTGSNRRDVGYLLENIIDPGSLVGLDYQLHLLTKKDGSVIAGMLKEKTDATLSVAMIGGTEVVIPLAEVEKHEVSTASMMPEGLIANLSGEEVRDLIGYLGSERQVPLPVEGEIFVGDGDLDVSEVNRGVVRQQKMGHFKGDSWSGGTQLWWTQGQPGDRLVLSFESAKDGRYEVLAVFTKAHDYGMLRVSVNGKIGVGEIDLFEKDGVVTTGEVSLGTHGIVGGKNQLVLELLGANPDASPGKMAGIDHLRLVPVK